MGLLFKNKVRTNMGKVALGRGLGLHFGGLWDHFLDTLVAFGRDLDVIGGPGDGFGAYFGVSKKHTKKGSASNPDEPR